GHQVAERNAQGNTHQAADLTKKDGLEDELAHDVPASSADGLADADLTCPLGDRHKHDVHDSDTGCEKCDQTDPRTPHREHPREALENGAHRVVRLELEIVRLAGRHLPNGAKVTYDLIHGGGHQMGGGCPYARSRHVSIAPTVFHEERRDRGENAIVQVEPKEIALRLQNADHLVACAVDRDLLVQGAFGRKKLIGNG